MDLELEGRVAVVTGASRGIGRAVARELSREGAVTVIAARGADALETAAAEIANETGRRVVPIVADTTDEASIRAMVDRVHRDHGRLDILVNNAAPLGGGGPTALSEITSSHLQAEMDVKVMGYLRCAQAVAPIMQKQRWGRIINVSGLAARMTGSIVGSIRNVSVVAMAKNLADLLGPSGINVNVVHPGATRTERTLAAADREAARRGVTRAEIEAEIAESSSIQHFVDAREVAWVVAFLASPKSIAINGDAIAVGGGQKHVIYY